MDFDKIMELIISLVIVPLVSWGVAVLIKLLNAKIEQVKSETIRKALKEAESELSTAVRNAVNETQQIFVDALKKEGKFDIVAAKTAFNMAFDRTKQIMSNAGMEVIQTATGALNELIAAQIESAVLWNRE